MKCLIIAAGQGTRMAGVGDSKPLIQLLGKPLIGRVIENMRDSGITEFCVVTGFNHEKVESALMAAKDELRVSIDFVYNPEWRLNNGISVLKGREKINEPFFLTMSDHMFDPSIISRMKSVPFGSHALKLGVDLRIEDNPCVDLDDVTRVWMDRETHNILDIGKQIEKYNAFDTGIFYCTPRLFEALEESIRQGDSSLSGGVRALAAQGQAGIIDIGDSFWIDVDNEEMLIKAESILKRRNL